MPLALFRFPTQITRAHHGTVERAHYRGHQVSRRPLGVVSKLDQGCHGAEPGPKPSRRALLAAVCVPALLSLSPGAQALGLHSANSSKPAVVTFHNSLANAVRIYWMNYDGDAELYASLGPGGWLSIDTFESHPWRVADAASGRVVAEYVAKPGEQVLRIDPFMLTAATPRSASPGGAGSGADFAGFDGLGGAADEYAKCQLAEMAVDVMGGIALLDAEGFEEPVPLRMGPSEAAQIYQAAGAEFRRPATVATWASTLQASGSKVQRVMLTRAVGPTLYARIVLRLPGGQQRSLDARPSDSLALALQTAAPLYISKQLARALQPGSLELDLGELVPHLLPPSVRRDAVPPPLAKANFGHVRSL